MLRMENVMSKLKLTQDQMWAAWEAKDAAYDGQFFVAVKTTGVYCRISCPARPLRKNVIFFVSCEQAEAAGYRACKRCHPRETALSGAAELTQRAIALIGSSGKARLNELSSQLNISPFHLQRTFKKVMGVSPLQYAKAQRANQIKQELRTNGRVTDAIYNAGFESASRMYENKILGMTPTIYKKGGSGMKIAYTVLPCLLGRMLMAGTPHGICAIYLGDDDSKLEAELMHEYPNAGIEKHISSELRDWADAVLAFMERKADHASLGRLPLDVQGTAFQARVWQALRQIPEGQTRSYSDIAKAIGQPTAMRAVANACGANKACIVIPCHRVVREDGSLGGYAWGSERKAALLARERQS
jgi:AraC family transcriptional regulator of adaptative response/methylated-DNA-[protein]-cysteine methyltransferase